MVNFDLTDPEANADRAVALVTKQHRRGSLVWMADFDVEALRFFYPGWNWEHYREVQRLVDLKLREKNFRVELAPITVQDYRSFIDSFMAEDSEANRRHFLDWRLKADQAQPPGPLRRQVPLPPWFKPLFSPPKTTSLGPM